MNPGLIILFILLYFGILLGIAYVTSKNSTASTYFTGNKVSPWYIVAFGMIGDSLSGVTYISVPGKVVNDHFSYLQLVLGYFAGYLVIAKVLLPVYYRLNLVSIYSYLETRFGKITQKTGSIFFILSRVLGAAGRLYLAAGVIQKFVFDAIEGLHIPFSASVSIIILLMLLYTYRGGIKTLVWTDSLQSLFLVLGVIFSIAAIADALHLSLFGTFSLIGKSEYSTVFFWDPLQGTFFPKQFFGGMFIAIAMTGLDQNMMQKNLSCKSLKEAQKNILWFSIVMVLVNIFFISLGVLLYSYYTQTGIDLPTKNIAGKVVTATDQVFPHLALNNYLGIFAGLSFILGLTAATFSSADSVLTTLTTSAYIDLFELDKKNTLTEVQKKYLRTGIHVCFAVILLVCILLFSAWNNSAIIDTILMVAGYTYGPLLGLFAFGLFTHKSIRDKMVPFVCVLAPILTYLLNYYFQHFSSFRIGPELIIYNGLISFILLSLTIKRKPMK